MSYVQRVLQPGEQIRRVSSIHWIVYWPGVAVAFLAVVAFWLSQTQLLTAFWRYTAYALALVAVDAGTVVVEVSVRLVLVLR